MRMCCVAGCDHKEKILHRFPNPTLDVADELYKKWLNNLRTPKLNQLTKENLYTTYRVCRKHFKSNCFSAGKRSLNFKSLPTLFLPQRPPDEVIEESEWATVVIMDDKQIVQDAKECKRKAISDETTCKKIKLTTRCDLQGIINTQRKTISTMTYRLKTARKRLWALKRVSVDTQLDKICSDLPKHILEFIKSQLKSVGKKPEGRRFTLNNKIMALGIYKQSPKAYALLSKIFYLPKQSTLQKLLKMISLECGVNAIELKCLSDTVAKLNPKERYCTLIFDKIPVNSNLTYSLKKDKIIGFEDFGDGQRTQHLADHAFVFMIQSIRGKIKQTVGFHFCDGITPIDILSTLIKKIVGELQSVGLTILATVCDQKSLNRDAINSLMGETNGFEVNGQTILPLYDAAHLLKSIRNFWLDFDIKCRIDNVETIGKWDHIVALYNIDRAEKPDARAIPGITDAHVIPNKIPKNKVSVCLQVFSQRVSGLMRLLAKQSGYDSDLPRNAQQTADIILFLDKLFDSMSGSSQGADKPLRSLLTNKSQHIKFWKEATDILDSLVFVNESGNNFRPTVLQDFVLTIKNIISIWNFLRTKKFGCIEMRNLNKDVAEKLFSEIKAHRYNGKHLSCFSFVSSYKAVYVKNLMNSHLLKTDGCSNLFTTAEDVFGSGANVVSAEQVKLPPCLYWESNTYLASWTAKLILDQINDNSCGCQESICGDVELLLPKKTEQQHVKQVSAQFLEDFNLTKSLFDERMQEICHIANLRDTLIETIKPNVSFSWINCDTHREDVIQLFLKMSVTILIFNWCKTVNKRLRDVKTIPYTHQIAKQKCTKKKKLSGKIVV